LLCSRAGFDQSTPQNECEGYSDDGECLGPLTEENFVADRCMFCPQCAVGSKKDSSGQCRIILKKWWESKNYLKKKNKFIWKFPKLSQNLTRNV